MLRQVRGELTTLVDKTHKRSEISAVAGSWKLADRFDLGIIDGPAVSTDAVTTELHGWHSEHKLLGAQSNAILPGAAQDIPNVRSVGGQVIIVDEAVINGLLEQGDMSERGVCAAIKLVSGRDQSLWVA